MEEVKKRLSIKKLKFSYAIADNFIVCVDGLKRILSSWLVYVWDMLLAKTHKDDTMCVRYASVAHILRLPN